ncbi:hypothetical protein ACFQPG_00765 [Sphingomonas sp. GCM10030256]|uniref:hypothetical protein n=1 Tax=Sphingomonas sp. GCM10030256 TaxID=3273427 RepID=UPI0036098871
MSLILIMFAAAAGPDLAGAATRQVAEQECRSQDDGDAIVVCRRRDAVGRYQVSDPKKWEPTAGVDSVSRERSRWTEHGDSGIGSCSAVGPGGWTGCQLKEKKRNRQQHKGWY